MLNPDTKTAIEQELFRLIRQAAGDVNLRPMYGGQVIELVVDQPKSRVGGVFAYDGHVSLELAKGAEFADPDGVLEGKGKARRHVKLRTLEDIAEKGCAGFLEQAVAGFQGEG